MQQAGWTIDNLHMFEPMIRMVVAEKRADQRRGIAYGRRSRHDVKIWWSAYAQELCERDPALTGEAMTGRCHASYDLFHSHGIGFNARSCMLNLQMQFQQYFGSIDDAPNYRQKIRIADQIITTY